MTIKIDHIYLKQLDRVLADTTKCGASDVMIAGGAIRDMLLGKPITDIDVFYQGELDDNKIKQYFKVKDKILKDDAKEYNEYYKEENTWQVYADSIHHEAVEYPVQLIVVKNDDPLPNHIKTFGCNLSKVLYNGHLSLSEWFLEDMWLEQLTFTEELRTGAYKTKLINKYSGWSVVDLNNQHEETTFF